MDPKLLNKAVQKRLIKIPYIQDRKIAELDSDEKILQLIDKTAAEIYSQITMDERYSGIDFAELIKEQVIDYVSQKINSNRAALEKFDYKSVQSLILAQRYAESFKIIGERKITPATVTINREQVAIFLSNYEKNVKRLERMVSTLNKQLIKIDLSSEVPADIIKRRRIRKKIADMTQEIRNNREAIAQINGGSPQVAIVFPPFTSLHEMSNKQIAAMSAIKNLNESPGKDPIAKINKYIQISKKMEKNLLQTANNISPGNYDIDKIHSVTKSLNMVRLIANRYLERLASNLVTRLGSLILQFPLGETEGLAVEAFLNFNKYISESKDTSPKIAEILSIKNPEAFQRLLEDSHRVNRHEKLRTRDKTPSAISKNLSAQEHRFLYLFDKIISHGGQSTSQERNQLSIMLEKSMGDVDFNRKLGAFSKERHPLSAKYKYTIIDIKYFGYKTTFSSEYNEVLLDKCEKALQQIEQGITPRKENKLTLFELGRLGDLGKLKEKMDKYHQLGLIEPSSKLQKLYAQVKRATEFLDKIEEQVADTQAYKSGDILMTHSKKSLAVKNKSADTETALTHTFISRYGHATQIYIDPDTNEPKLSHIYGSYQSDKIKATDSVMSDVFRVDPIKLISTEMQEKLEKYYAAKGLDYKQEIRNLFEQNAQKLHAEGQQRFEDIKNDKPSRFRAGLADFRLYGGHVTSTPVDSSELHKEMYGRDGYKIHDKMICSEFVARSLIGALHETNENLKGSLSEAGVWEESETIVRMPLQRENYSRVHPQRLIELLHKEGCLEQVAPPDALARLIDRDILNVKIDKTNLKKPIAAFYDELVVLAKQHEGDTTSFITAAIKASETYAQREKLDLDFEDPKLLNFLDINFSKIHEKINEKPSIIVQFFRDFASFLGFKPKAQARVEKMIPDLEKIQAKSITSKYDRGNKGDNDKIDSTATDNFKALKEQIASLKNSNKEKTNMAPSKRGV